MDSVGIKANPTPVYVVILRKNDIKAAEELPLFKHALTRQEILTNLTKAAFSMDIGRRRKVPEWEAKLIMDLHKEGMYPGQISEFLWNRYELARYPAHIRKIIKREGSRSTS